MEISQARPQLAGGAALPAARLAVGAAAWALVMALPPAAARELPPLLGVEPAVENKPVEAELLADLGAVEPGKPFSAGVLLRIAEGWHVYWENPGDAGLATSVELVLPKGWRAGPLLWPTPKRFQQPGDIVAYGYEGQVLLWARIHPPADLRVGQWVEIGARASWLGCKGTCVPGEARLRLRLPVAAKARPANAELFQTWRRRLPVPAEKSEAVASVAVERHAASDRPAGRFAVVVTWKQPPAEVEWFPAAGRELAVEGVSIERAGERTRIAFRAAAVGGAKALPQRLDTVLAFVGRDGRRQAVCLPILLRLSDGGGASPSGGDRASPSSLPGRAPGTTTQRSHP